MHAERFELRAGDKVWAVLTFEADGRTVLDHNLTEDEVTLCPGLGLYDESGQTVEIALGDIGNGQTGVRLYWPDRRIRRKFRLDLDMRNSTCDLADVSDPKKQVCLEAKLTGLGTSGNQPLQAGGIALNLRWIGHRS